MNRDEWVTDRLPTKDELPDRYGRGRWIHRSGLFWVWNPDEMVSLARYQLPPGKNDKGEPYIGYWWDLKSYAAWMPCPVPEPPQ